jgi:hypothetical protein
MRTARYCFLLLSITLCLPLEAGTISEFCLRNLAQLAGPPRYKPISPDLFFRLTSANQLADNIPDLAVIKNMHSPWFLVTRDHEVDPVLNAWLLRTKEKYQSISDPLERAARVAAEVRKTFKNDEFSLRHPLLSAALTASKSQKDIVKFGDFIAAGVGVCRHEAILMQLALQDAGIPSKVIYGDVKQIDSADGEVLRQEPHAWVQVQTPKGLFAFDPRIIPEGRSVDDGAAFGQPGSSLFGKFVVHYKPFSPDSVWNGPRAIDEEGLKELRMQYPGLGSP